MKYLLLVAAAALLVQSCRKCHECELKEAVNGTQFSNSKSEFCGSKRKMRQHESENTETRSAVISNVTVTYTKDMNCN